MYQYVKINSEHQEGFEILNNTRFDNGLDWSRILLLIGKKDEKYKTQDIIELLEKYNIMEEVKTIGTFKKPFIYIIEVRNKHLTEKILKYEYLEIENKKFKTFKPNSNTIKATLHWLPPNINNEAINTAFNNYGQTLKIIDLKLNSSKYPNLKTTKKIIILKLKNNITMDDLPYFTKINNCNI